MMSQAARGRELAGESILSGLQSVHEQLPLIGATESNSNDRIKPGLEQAHDPWP
jgi:hypothetical protein